MRFRLKAFGLHLLGSASALTLVLGVLYLGWYRWPGWYLSGVAHVILIMVGVDVVLGPLLTMIVANSSKPLRELRRDIGIIVTVQLIALGYGTTALWDGRPLYYAFSADCLEIVQASEVKETNTGTGPAPDLAPHWYSLPRWIWAPLPQDAEAAQKIVVSALQGGADVTGMPQYYKPWNQGLGDLKRTLKKVDDIRYFSSRQKQVLKQRLQASGFSPEAPNGIALMGRGPSLLAVIDPASLEIQAIINST